MTYSSKRLSLIYWLLLTATIAVFFGRAYQHLYWDAPFRALLWDENWMKGFIHTFTSMSWEKFVTSMEMDDRIQNVIRGFGIFYLFCGIAAIFLKKYSWFKIPIIIGSFFLVLLAALYMKEKFFHVGQFFEYSLQFMAPIFLIWFLKNGITPRLILAMKTTIALTFVCHGLYAIGYYPRPGNFVDMTINSFGCSETRAIQYLTIVGYLDFIVGLGIFLPWKVSKFIIAYAILWGSLTTTARLFSYLAVDEFLLLLHQWGFEALYRFPHFLIPIALFLMLKKEHP